ALRPERIGRYNSGPSTLTPAIDEWSNQAFVSRNCFACTNVTDSSMTTITTGRYPTRHGIINHASRVTEEERRLVMNSKNLPEWLSDEFYTFAVDKLERWHTRGFDEYTYPSPEKTSSLSLLSIARELKNQLPSHIQNPIEDAYSMVFPEPETEITHASAPAVTDATLQQIRSTDDNWVGLVHYWDVHLPYQNVDEITVKSDDCYYDEQPLPEVLQNIEGSPWYNQLLGQLAGEAETLGDLQRDYDRSVHLVDQEFGRLIAGLKSEGIAEDTAIILTADHGESFTEHDIFFEHHGLYDASLNVPLIVDAPGININSSQFIQHFDLVPTILDLLNISYNSEVFDGSSLIADANAIEARDAIFAEEAHTTRRRAIRTDQYKYIELLSGTPTCRYCEINHGPSKELYDIRSDPDEETNIYESNPEIAKRLKYRLSDWVESIPTPEPANEGFKPDSDAVERLEAMGYL
ncbi:MAG: sulfatase, partial [Halobacteriaceae archaeon]